MASNRSPAQVAVVLQADLHLPVQTGLGHPTGGEIHLFATEGHPDHLGAVPAGGVDGHGAPSAADVEEPGARGADDAQLAADQLVLGFLGVFQRGGLVDEPGARVGHGGPEHQAVELVAHVVVVADDLGVAGRRVQAADGPALLWRRGRRRPEDPQATCGPDHGGQGPEADPAEIPRRGVVQGAQQRVQVALDGQVAGDVGPGHAQLARGPQDPPDGVRRADPQGPDAVGGPDAGTVPELEPDRDARAHHGPHERGQRRGGTVTGRWIGATVRGVVRSSRSGGPAGGVQWGTLRCGRCARQLGDHGRPPRPGATIPVGVDPRTVRRSSTRPGGRPVRAGSGGAPRSGEAYRPVRAEILPVRTALTRSS